MNSLPEKLAQKLARRKEQGAYRSLSDPAGLVDFTSNDYLGLAQAKELIPLAEKWLKSNHVQANGSTGSRLLSGNSALHEQLENYLSGKYQAKAALLFNSGYNANLALLGSLPQRGDLVLFDEQVHASIREGLQLCKARCLKFRHNDLEDLDRTYQRNRPQDGTVYLVTESIYSMDGSMPDLEAISKWSKAQQVYWILDEAHATGLYGDQGSGLGKGLDVFARLMTFGKAMGSHGAVVLGSEELKTYLINFGRSLIYTTSLPPHTLASIWAAHEYGALDKRVSDLQNRIHYFKTRMKALELTPYFLVSESPIQACIIPGNERVRQVSKQLQQAGFDVRPILSPTVEAGSERLRFCIHTFNTEEQMGQMLEYLATALS